MKYPCRHRFLGLVDVSAAWRGWPGVVRDIFNQIDGSLYLKRVYLLPAVYLHMIAQADSDRHLHDHPWAWAWSLILRGGYVEERPWAADAEGWPWRRLVPGDTNLLRSHNYHRIVTVEPNTWTLFVTGPRTKSWGFLTAKGHEDFRTYLGRAT